MRTIQTILSPFSTPPMVDIVVLENLFDRFPDVAFFVKDISGHYISVNTSLSSDMD